jgi:hypothetical protein
VFFFYILFRSTERLLELLLLRRQALEILFRRLKEWLFAELVPVLVLGFTSITKICHRFLKKQKKICHRWLLLVVCGIDFCMSLGAQALALHRGYPFVLDII